MRTRLASRILVGSAALRAVTSFAVVGPRSPLPRAPSSDSLRLARGINPDLSFEVDVDVDTDDPRLHEQIEELVRRRGEARWAGNYADADFLRVQLDDVVERSGCSLRIADLPRSQGGGSTWKLVRVVPVPLLSSSKPAKVLHLAHAALGMAVSYSDRGMFSPRNELKELVQKAKVQLESWNAVHKHLNASISSHDEGPKDDVWSGNQVELLLKRSPDLVASWYSVEKNLGGRKAADAAFWFALAGCHDIELFRLLTRVCEKELARFGTRPSCRPKDVLSVAHRLAAAGVRNDAPVEELIRRCLNLKTRQDDSYNEELPNALDLHSNASSLLLWKFSTRQKKQKSFLMNAATNWQRNHHTLNSSNDPMSSWNGRTASQLTVDWGSLFADPTRPLVVDVGCGMGLSLLGLASLDQDGDYGCCHWLQGCNFIGVDLSSAAIGFAQGTATRWNLDRLVFVVGSSEQLLKDLLCYAGPVRKILIQFPTPYRLATTKERAGNAQLPSIDGFMVTKNLLKLSRSLLRMSRDGEKRLLIQSNCEDVAVWMRNLACSDDMFEVVIQERSVQTACAGMTQRTRNWIDQKGERAVGPGWSACPLLPRRGQTETEAACGLNRIPVHRAVLKPTEAKRNGPEQNHIIP
jgi:tRNA G46 methylase TrmB